MKKLTVSIMALFCLFVTGAMANKTSVTVKAPEEVTAGSEVIITIDVMHKGNSRAPHTDWVYLKINGQEVQRWGFTKEELPQEENFTLVYKLTATEPLTIEAEGHCSIHGTAGLQTITVKIQ
jgi:desulfoferrodoxin (superoxide reductase-like protein)